MILDDIRKVKLTMNELQLKIDSFSTSGAIRYDKDVVQTSPSGDSLEKAVIRLLEGKEQLEHLKKEYQELCSKVDYSLYSTRQLEFIRLFYLQGYDMKRCCSLMRTTYNNLYNIRVNIFSITLAKVK